MLSIPTIARSWSVIEDEHTIDSAGYLVLTNMWSRQDLERVGLSIATLKPNSANRHKYSELSSAFKISIFMSPAIIKQELLLIGMMTDSSESKKLLLMFLKDGER